MLTRIAELALRAPKRVLSVAALVLVAGAVFGGPVAEHLLSGGFTNPSADSTKATKILDQRFHGGQPNIVFLVEAPGGARSAAAKQAAGEVVQGLAGHQEWLTFTQSFSTAPAGSAASLISKDGKYGLVIAHVAGDDTEIQTRAGVLAGLAGPRGPATVTAGGAALAYHQVNDQTKSDLLVAEMIAIPLTAVALILVFGSMIAALLPLAIGIFAIVETLAVLRSLSLFTDVSIYAMNMTTALGLALAIDYSLFMVSRYREEVRNGRDPHDAVLTTVRTAGRTVIFSAVTVALSLAALAVFPMYFLRSFAYAGLAVVALAAVASIVILPACLALIGPRINALDLRVGVRRLLKRPAPAVKTLEQGFWYRLASAVMRRPVALGAAVTVLFLLLGSPFLRADFGYPDDRVLTTEQSARAVGDILRTDFEQDAAARMSGVAPSVASDPSGIADYTQAISRVDGASTVTSPAGIYRDGKRLAAAPPGFAAGDTVRFQVDSAVDPFSDAGSRLVHDLRDTSAPWRVLWSGAPAFNVDAIAGLSADLPLALALIAIATFVVLFLFTGSVVVPLKALVLNLLSLTATFGAMVWVFQDGHLSDWLGFTPTGYLVANMVILMFCLAFGMSMDYEVFLLSRIREEWERSDKTHEANTRAVSLGLARTGKIVTAAALLMSIVFAAMVGSTVQFMQLFGLGLTLAVLADATLVRGILVPAFMRLMGRANWWAPKPLARLHDRFGLTEADDGPVRPARELEEAGAV